MKQIIVAGLGRSAEEFAHRANDYWTIGVNDIDRYFPPDHLYVCDEPTRFKGDRRGFVNNTKAKTVWTPVPQKWKLDLHHPDIRKVKTRKFDLEGFDLRREYLPHFRTSVFAAIGLAYKFGAKRIGVIGMDLLPPHKIHPYAGPIGEQLAKLAIMFSREGVELVNLSSIARIYTIPRASISIMKTKESLIKEGDSDKHAFTGWTHVK